MKTIEDILNKEEIEQLKSNGYSPVRYLGSGHTRDVIEVLYEKEGLRKVRALKIPKKDIDDDSLCTFINLSRLPKGNPNVNELESISEMGSHENIADIIEVTNIGGRVSTFEEFIDGQTLKEKIEEGPLNKEQFFNVFKQVLEGVYHAHTLHYFNPIVHRDLKPSNILVGKNGKVKITDWQNAKTKTDIDDKILPTRGGTAYTYPELFNSIIDKNGRKCGVNTDIYALGAIMYNALTSEEPFDYKLDYDKDGKELEIEGKKVRVSLFKGKEKIDKITKKEFEKDLKQKLKKVPKRYQHILTKCLTLDENKKYDDICKLRSDFENANKRFSFREYLAKHGEKIAWGTGILSLFGLIAFGTKNTEIRDVDHSPTLYELLDNKRYFNKAQLSLNTPTIKFPIDITKELKPYVSEIKDKIDDENIKEILNMSKYISRVHMREDEWNELNAILIACELTEKDNKTKVYDTERTDNFLVPIDFIESFLSDLYSNELSDLDFFEEAGFASHYLISLDGYKIGLEDLFVRYFCNEEEIFNAKKSSESFKSGYFPRFDEGEHSGLIKGYGDYLPQSKRELIDRTLAAYFVMSDMDKESLAQK